MIRFLSVCKVVQLSFERLNRDPVDLVYRARHGHRLDTRYSWLDGFPGHESEFQLPSPVTTA